MENFVTFKLIILGVLLEALPFILLGSLVSALIHHLVSEETIKKYLPKNRLLGIVMASLMGLVFPVCECAIVPIVRRLIKKGVPLYMGITFMVSVPIVNPVVLFSTFVAFKGFPEIAVLRGIMGLVVAWTLGGILSVLDLTNQEVLLDQPHKTTACGCHEAEPNLVQLQLKTPKRQHPIHEILHHTSVEFYDIGKLLVIGAVLSASFKTFIPRGLMMSFGQNEVLSILAMMAFAFVLSLCSEVDAFIARTFRDMFSTGSVLAFLVLGPMIDVKNYLMLCGSFRRGFVLLLTTLIFTLVFIMSYMTAMV